MIHRTSFSRIGSLCVGMALVTAACSSSGDAPSTAATSTVVVQSETTPAPVATSASAPAPTTATDAAGGNLEGLKGVTPLAEPTDAFRARLLGEDPGLLDFALAPEVYDIITIVALAVELAKDDGIAYASEIQGITRDGAKCADFASCTAIIDADGDPDYDGLSGSITLNGVGDPLEASYRVITMGRTDRIDPTLTTYITAVAPPEADLPPVPVQGTRPGDGQLTIGAILPLTGGLSYLGPAQRASAELAVADINASGGVLGRPAVFIAEDGAVTTEASSQAVGRLLAQDVDAIVGATSSPISLEVLGAITDAGVVQFSPANLSDAFTAVGDKGLYFRLAPPDRLQGSAIGHLMSGDGATKVAIIARDDTYGNGVATSLQQTLEAAGVVVSLVKFYKTNATSFDAEVAEVAAAAPDAIALIGFEETSKLLRTMVDSGLGPRDIAVYGCDGNIGDALGEDFDAGQ